MYDFLERKLVLRHLPSMMFSSSSDEENDNVIADNDLEDEEDVKEGRKEKRPDSPCPTFIPSPKLLHRFHNVEKYYI